MVRAENYSFSLCLWGIIVGNRWGADLLCHFQVGMQPLATAKKDTSSSEFFLKTPLLFLLSQAKLCETQNWNSGKLCGSGLMGANRTLESLRWPQPANSLGAGSLPKTWATVPKRQWSIQRGYLYFMGFFFCLLPLLKQNWHYLLSKQLERRYLVFSQSKQREIALVSLGQE